MGWDHGNREGIISELEHRGEERRIENYSVSDWKISGWWCPLLETRKRGKE